MAYLHNICIIVSIFLSPGVIEMQKISCVCQVMRIRFDNGFYLIRNRLSHKLIGKEIIIWLMSNNPILAKGMG